MKSEIDFNGYDTLLQPTDWRYAAAALGLVKYLDYHKISYQTLYDIDTNPVNLVEGFDGILYKKSDITQERYLDFAESYFKSDMTHKSILAILESDEFDDEQIKLVKNLVESKTVLKNCFAKKKFDGTNKDYYKNVIEDKRYTIVRDIFRYGKNLYSDYCNKNLLFSDSNPHCRLVGYNVDEGRKTKSLGFCFSKDSFTENDIPEFDFIPFAFSNAEMYETFFINNNYSIKKLVKTNQWLSEALRETEDNDSRNKLYTVLKNANKFIDFDVEIISKVRDEEFYQTLYVRSERLKPLQMIGERELSFKYKISDDNWLNLEREVCENCLNGVYLDELILLMLKISFDENVNKATVRKRIQTLITIDEFWKGNDNMTEIESAKKIGFIVAQELVKNGKANKVNTYKQKLIGALTAHDYDRVNEILLSLSAYVGIEFSFFYSLLENPEENKNIALAFASALTVNNHNN